MPLRAMLLPAVLIAATLIYIVANAGGTTVANPDATATPPPTNTPRPSPTAIPPSAVPEGTTGLLTYRTGSEAVTVDMATLTQRARTLHQPDESAAQRAGYASIERQCDDTGCTLVVAYPNGTSSEHRFASTGWEEWSPDGSALAIGVVALDGRSQVLVLDGGEPRALVETAGEIIEAFSWLDGGVLAALADTRGTRLVVFDADGRGRDIAFVPVRVSYFYRSPDSSKYVFTQAAPDGWQLWMYDAATDAVTSLGNMGSDPSGTTPPTDSSPEGGKGGPMYVAWSPDGTQIAYGGGFTPPYVMTIVDITAGGAVHTAFPAGYPGEIHWSPDGTSVAVSTYDLERRHHETWTVDPNTGAGVHLMNGCVIVWSPDSRFLAVHGEDRPGIAIVDVVTRERGQLTHAPHDAPLSWE
jgi:hypothetical protein